MYDCLVSMHVTCCEHISLYFAYWHRWHLLKFEQYLFLAHQRIQDKSFLENEKGRLKELADRAQGKPVDLKEIDKLLQGMQKDYQNII